ncbi:calcium-binding protein [Pseudodonghicola flavimaris]|uniref:Calcium-binding protein n=1 Tax=Pseudodonghicola flavimaris TaxID=3050036 RepID=A0ABT7F829_9RHOB|nr:hypothetical protein [Pseudodonghicola flavimaris]MDK3020769.1 hypothetical protein [Pseudodonghicola flavimaris]
MARISGTRFDDRMIARSTGDTYLGEKGDDTFVFSEDTIRNKFVGGLGADRVEGEIRVDEADDLSEALVGMTFNGDRGVDTLHLTAIVEQAELTLSLSDFGASLKSVENLELKLITSLSPGDFGDVTIRGGARAEKLEFIPDNYNEERVAINMGKGADTVYLGSATTVVNSAVVNGGGGADTIINISGDDGTQLLGGTGNDLIVTRGVSMERVKGGGGADHIQLEGSYRNFDYDIVSGNGGKDIFEIARVSDDPMAIITDFKRTKDKILISDDSLSAEDLIVVAKGDSVGSEYGKLYLDLNDSTLVYRGDVIVDLDGAAVRSSDILFDIA